MKAVGIALAIVGYALLYSGASNLFTNGQGWGFLQALLNKGEANQSGSFGNLMPKGSTGDSSGGGLTGDLLGGLGKLLNGLHNIVPGI